MNKKTNQDIFNDIIQWDVNTWSKALFYWEKNHRFDETQFGLELGGRQGGLSLWLALKGLHVICSDLKNTKTTAEKLHKKHNVSHLITYEDMDACLIPHENKFDVIVFKSIIGVVGSNNQLDKQIIAFQEIYKALKPGGKLFFAENLIASPLHKFFRKYFVKWSSYWRYVSLEEMNLFLKDFSSVSIKANGFLAAFGRSEKQRLFLSRLDDLFFNKFIPNKWKYVVYGVAIK